MMIMATCMKVNGGKEKDMVGVVLFMVDDLLMHLVGMFTKVIGRTTSGVLSIVVCRSQLRVWEWDKLHSHMIYWFQTEIKELT